MSSAILAPILSSVVTTAGNIALSERQRKKNEDYQAQQNIYNLPKNQVQRLQDAGINPNSLSMGAGSSIPGNTSAPINPYSTPSLADPMSMASNSFLALQQGKTEDQMREIRKQQAVADIEQMQANAQKLGVDAEYQGILNTFASAKEMAAVQESNSRTRLNVWQVAKVKQEARQLAKYVDEVMPEELKKIIAEKNLTVAQLDEVIATIANIEADTSLKESQTDVADTQAALNVEQRGLVSQESAKYDEVTKAVLNKYQAEINKLAAETNLTNEQAFYYLYDLAMKYRVQLFGIPMPGAGGIRNNLNSDDIQKQVHDKYFSE